MKSDFSHLKKFEVRKEDTVEYEMFEIETAPVLIVRCTADNPEYQAAIRGKRETITRQLRKQKKSRGRTRVGDQIFDLLRGPDRETYPGTVVVGWKTNKDAAGKEVKYTDDACADFLAALPDWLFDGLRVYVIDASNFIQIPMTEEEEEDLAKNSSSG